MEEYCKNCGAKLTKYRKFCWDHETINMYHSAGSKIDSRSVSLNPTSRTHTF